MRKLHTYLVLIKNNKMTKKTESETQSIWDWAVDKDREERACGKTTDRHGTNERSMLVLGSKGVGKTTLILRMLERSEGAKPTLALEYTYGRRSNASLSKDVCHVWELGGGTLSLKLLETPLSPSKLTSLHVVLMVNLAKPEELWYTLETCMDALEAYLKRALKTPEGVENKLEEKLQQLLKDRSDPEHPDINAMKPFPLPLLITGGYYDGFQNMDSEKKKIVCRALRYFAHFHGASLQFYSATDSGLVKKARDVLSHHAFGSEAGKGVSQDYNKPLIVPAWSDSFASISGQSGDSGGEKNLEMWKHQFTTHFPQSITEATALPEDPAKDPNFREPLIDQLRAQKDEDLERYRKEIERRSRQWGDEFDQSIKR